MSTAKGLRVTYAASSAAFTPGATPEDVFTITGSATKTVYVTKVTLSTTQTTAGVNAWFIKKRSTANSGGTSAALTEVPLDKSHAAASATCLSYTANPTAGDLVGSVWTGHINAPAPGTAGIGDLVQTVDFVQQYGQPVVLKGITDVLSWNFNGAALPVGLSVLASVVWYEE